MIPLDLVVIPGGGLFESFLIYLDGFTAFTGDYLAVFFLGDGLTDFAGEASLLPFTGDYLAVFILGD